MQLAIKQFDPIHRIVLIAEYKGKSPGLIREIIPRKVAHSAALIKCLDAGDIIANLHLADDPSEIWPNINGKNAVVSQPELETGLIISKIAYASDRVMSRRYFSFISQPVD